jgi:methyl-accepting chemotaxis protein
MKFVNLKLGWKLTIGFGFMVAMMGIISLIFYFSFSNIKEHYNIREEIADLQQSFDRMRQATWNYKFTKLKVEVDHVNDEIQNMTKLLTKLQEKEDEKNIVIQYEELLKTVNNFSVAFLQYKEFEEEQKTAIIKLNSLGEETYAEITQIKENGEKAAFQDARLHALKLINTSSEQDLAEFNKAIEKCSQILKGGKNEILVSKINDYKNQVDFVEMNENKQNQIIDNLDKADLDTRQRIHSMSENYANSMNEVISTMAITMNVIILISIIMGIIFSYIITKGISKGLKRAVGISNTLAEGNLDIQIESGYLTRKDEIGQLANAMQTMIDKFKEVVDNVVSGAEYITAASEQLSANSQLVSQGATEQASSAEEASTAIEEMASNIHQNADNSQVTGKLASKASNDIQDTMEKVMHTVEAMKLIASKVRIIDDIAFQTNILALNAAVEAARAGDQGRGFAVVASEVRKLAEKSQLAAAEINMLATNSVKEAELSGGLLQSLVPEIQKTANLVMEISASSIEQNAGASQINTAIQQLNSVIQQNAASAEEMATSAEELESQAEQMHEMISFFKTGVYRNRNTSNSHLKGKKTTKSTFQGNHYANNSQSGYTYAPRKNDDLDKNFERY